VSVKRELRRTVFHVAPKPADTSSLDQVLDLADDTATEQYASQR